MTIKHNLFLYTILCISFCNNLNYSSEITNPQATINTQQQTTSNINVMNNQDKENHSSIDNINLVNSDTEDIKNIHNTKQIDNNTLQKTENNTSDNTSILEIRPNNKVDNTTQIPPNNSDLKEVSETNILQDSNNTLEINNNPNIEQDINKLFNDIIQLVINQKSYQVIFHDILPLWDRAIICIITNNLMNSEQLINTWSNLYNSNKEQINNAINQIKNIDPDFKEEILGNKLFQLENAKKFIMNIKLSGNITKNTNSIINEKNNMNNNLQSNNINNNENKITTTSINSDNINEMKADISKVNQNNDLQKPAIQPNIQANAQMNSVTESRKIMDNNQIDNSNNNEMKTIKIL